jgi:hypothetical protein
MEEVGGERAIIKIYIVTIRRLWAAIVMCSLVEEKMLVKIKQNKNKLQKINENL